MKLPKVVVPSFEGVKIEKNIPLPAMRRSTKWAELSALVLEMKVGDSIFIPLPEAEDDRRVTRLRMASTISRVSRIYPEYFFETHVLCEGGVWGLRVWRRVRPAEDMPELPAKVKKALVSGSKKTTMKRRAA